MYAISESYPLLSHGFSYNSNNGKKITEETVTFSLLAMLQEEFLFCVSVWGTWCGFLHKV